MASIDKKILRSALEYQVLKPNSPFLWHCYPTINYCNAILTSIASSPVGIGVEKITELSGVPKFTARILIQWLEKEAGLIKGEFNEGLKFYVLVKLAKPQKKSKAP